jgi:integrase
MITINGYIFTGHYADLCRRFIEYKQSIGYKYEGRIVRRIRQLNEYLNQNSTNKSDDDYSLSKDIVLGYTAKKDNETHRTQEARESLIRQFALFLNTIGIQAHVVSWRAKPKSTFTPYIFTKEQMRSILDVADNLEYEYRSPNYHHVYPFLLRLLYCCGLRISEALSLKIADIDFEDRLIKIKQAKYNNFRLVPMSDSLFAALEKYLAQTGFPKTDTGKLFRTKWNKCYQPHSVLSRFKDFQKKAGIPFTENGGLPRIHDIRHTFAVHSLDSMAQQGIDTYLAIPYLTVYMGHRKIKCTEQYLRLTQTSYEGIIEQMESFYDGLFPKVGEPK